MGRSIYECVSRLVRKFGTRDAFEIAEMLGIEIIRSDKLRKLNGMYMYILRNPYIVINSSISEQLQRIICAHELGHDRLHRELAAKSGIINEVTMFDMTTRPEYEANVFAAELLISDDDILELIEEGCDLFQAAARLDTDANLAALKLLQMKGRGYSIDIDLSLYDGRFITG